MSLATTVAMISRRSRWRRISSSKRRQFLREVGLQGLEEMRVVRSGGGHDVLGEVELAVGQQHRQLGPRQAAPGLRALGDARAAPGRPSSARSSAAARLQVVHERGLRLQVGRGLRLQQRERQGLVVVVGQHMDGDLVGHRGQQRVARLLLQLARPLGHAGQDLDVHLVVGGVDAGRIVDGVGVDPPAGQRVFDAPGLGEAEIGAFADHAGSADRGR